MGGHNRTPDATESRVKTLHRRYPKLSNRELARRAGLHRSVVDRLLAGRYRSGVAEAARGSLNGAARLDEGLVRRIRTGAWRDRQASEIARELDLDVGTVERARRGESWRHVR